MNNHSDIRIGTLVGANRDAHRYIEQILPHGFESFSLTFWERIGDVDLSDLAERAKSACGERAVISSIGLFGNPLQEPDCAEAFGQCIRAAHLFGCSIVAGFAGALDGREVTESFPKFKEVWTPLAKLAEDHGVKIAFENCDMGGWWQGARYNIAHAPTTWEHLFNEVPSEALGLEWEPCHQLVSLADPLPQLRKWLPRIFHVHGKDATVAWDVIRECGIRGGKPYVWHRHPGFGDTNWTDLISILRQGGYRGSIDIEGWHDPVYKGDMEMTGQVHALKYLKQCRGGPFVPNPVV
jgi:sugar phosphate isomerase/epimerase